MVPLGLFKDRVFSSANALYMLAYASLAGMFFFVTLYFQNVKGWSAVRTGDVVDPPQRALPGDLAVRRAHREALRHGADVSAGFVVAGIGMLGLGRLDVESSYAAAWPWYLLIGLGYGMLVPAVSSAAMSAVPADHSGAGSGILNSSRQVGAAVGLAVLGSLSVATASHAWRASLGAFPEAARAQAAALVQQVAGGEGPAVAAAVGPGALAPAFDAFVAGYRVALLIAGLLLLVGAAVACIGLRPRRSG